MGISLMTRSVGGRAPDSKTFFCVSMFVFFAWPYLVLDFTDSMCTGKGVGAGCLDTFVLIIPWFTLLDVFSNATVLSLFMGQWSTVMTYLNDEAVDHFLKQFLPTLFRIRPRFCWSCA